MPIHIMMAYGGAGCIAQHILNLGTILGMSGWLHDQATLPRGKKELWLLWTFCADVVF
jgi:uncharacterized FAD-dependent dehydrogenase